MDLSVLEGENKIISWFESNSYQPQANYHIEAICDAFLDDLVSVSSGIANAAQQGELVYSRNYSLSGPDFIGDIDLVLGPPEDDTRQKQLAETTKSINEGDVNDVWLAFNIESLVSSVGKNWKNRGREIHSYYLSIYDEYPTAVTGSLILLNVTDLDDRNPNEILGAYREFEFAEGSLAQRLDSLAVVPLENADTDEARYAEGIIDGDDTLGYKSLVKTLAQGVEQRLQGNVEISEATLKALLTYDESERLEFKRRVGGTQDIAKEAVALANNEGGRILYGVADNGGAIGLGEIETAENKVTNVLEESVDPNVVDHVRRHTVNGSNILEVKIKRMGQVPSSYNGIFYLRTGTSTAKLTGHEIVTRFPRE
jgi:hypothetical protein